MHIICITIYLLPPGLSTNVGAAIIVTTCGAIWSGIKANKSCLGPVSTYSSSTGLGFGGHSTTIGALWSIAKVGWDGIVNPLRVTGHGNAAHFTPASTYRFGGGGGNRSHFCGFCFELEK